MGTKIIRAVIAEETYNKIILINNLPFKIGFDKSIKLLIENYEKLLKEKSDTI